MQRALLACLGCATLVAYVSLSRGDLPASSLLATDVAVTRGTLASATPASQKVSLPRHAASAIEQRPILSRSSSTTTLQVHSTDAATASLPAAFVALAGGFLATFVWATRTQSSPATKTEAPLTWPIITVLGERGSFDPLSLDQSPMPTRDACVTHGRAVLAVFAAFHGLVAAPAFAADGIPGTDSVDSWIIALFALGQAFAFLGFVSMANTVKEQKEEIEELTGTLEKVYAQLRQRARVRQQEIAAQMPAVLMSPVLDQEFVGEKQAILNELRKGRQALRAGDGEASLRDFQHAKELLRSGHAIDDALRLERKAERGIAAALQQLKRTEEALAALQNVLKLTAKIGDTTGLEEAYGVMADLYTDLNKFDEAGKYYDLHLRQEELDSVTGADGAL